jgi:hypothetical protein
LFPGREKGPLPGNNKKQSNDKTDMKSQAREIIIGEMTPEQKKTALFWAQCNFDIAGDVGDFTVWTTQRGKQVWIKRAPPDKPPSNKQFKQRARFRKAMENWKLVSPEDRAKWNEIGFRLGICASGMNLHMSLGLNPDHENFAAVTTKLDIHPPEPEPIP